MCVFAVWDRREGHRQPGPDGPQNSQEDRKSRLHGHPAAARMSQRVHAAKRHTRPVPPLQHSQLGPHQLQKAGVVDRKCLTTLLSSILPVSQGTEPTYQSIPPPLLSLRAIFLPLLVAEILQRSFESRVVVDLIRHEVDVCSCHQTVFFFSPTSGLRGAIIGCHVWGRLWCCCFCRPAEASRVAAVCVSYSAAITTDRGRSILCICDSSTPFMLQCDLLVQDAVFCK